MKRSFAKIRWQRAVSATLLAASGAMLGCDPAQSITTLVNAREISAPCVEKSLTSAGWTLQPIAEGFHARRGELGVAIFFRDRTRGPLFGQHKAAVALPLAAIGMRSKHTDDKLRRGEPLQREVAALIVASCAPMASVSCLNHGTGLETERCFPPPP